MHNADVSAMKDQGSPNRSTSTWDYMQVQLAGALMAGNARQGKAEEARSGLP